MRRRLLTTLVVLAFMWAPGGHAQKDDKVVTLWSLGAYDILYVLHGGGANALALMRDDGVVLIDPLPVGYGQASLDAIATVCDQPVRTIVNIRSSDEHLGANAEYPTATRIVAARSVAERARQSRVFAGAAARFAPTTIVTDRLSLLDGPDLMDLYYVGPGKTDGDLVVVFPAKRSAYLGDLLPSKSVPVVDAARGGRAIAFSETLAKIRSQITGVRTAVPGHESPREGEVGSAKPGAVMPMTLTMAWKDVEEYADFTRDFLAAVQEAMKAGKTAEQAAAGISLPDRYKGYDMRGAKAAVDAIYAEVKGR